MIMKWKYKYSSEFGTKSRAELYADWYRDRGFRAVINKVPNIKLYRVYIYKK